MSTDKNAIIVRDQLEHLGFLRAAVGLEALDALIAERDEALSRAETVKLFFSAAAERHLEKRREALAERDRLREVLRIVIATAAPPIEALCAVHADAKYIAPETLTELLEARATLRTALIDVRPT